MKPIIEISNLTKKFGKFVAVNRINFNIMPGEILGFLGPNGAGKTTTIKMIIGLLKITSGEILVKGVNSVKYRRTLKEIMGYMSQKFSLYPLLNSLENIEFFGGISGMARKQIRGKKSEIMAGIPLQILKQPVKDIPPGIKQKIALFVCLMTNPEIILLDEPTSGVDPEVRRNFWMQIYDLKKMGKTILVSTHNLDEVEFADRVIIIHRGNIILEGEPSRLQEKYEKDSMEELFMDAIKQYERQPENPGKFSGKETDGNRRPG
jgi:ABC-2 type transport system ATP-binding protein